MIMILKKNFKKVELEPCRCILLPNWIGDFMLSLPVVAQMKSSFKPEERLVLLVAPHLVSLCRYLSQQVDFLNGVKIIPYHRSSVKHYISTIQSVKKENIYSIYLLPHSLSSAFFSFLCQIPNRRGVVREGRSVFLTDRLPLSIRDDTQHITKEYATVLHCVPPLVEQWSCTRIPGNQIYTDTIVFCPGAHYGPAKQWPYFDQLAARIQHKQIIILGSTLDHSAAEHIAKQGSHVTNLVGSTNLIEALQIISSAACVVSNDSGLMHIAGFCNTPVIGIFGSTSPQWTKPLGRESISIYAKEKCSPCFKRTCAYGHYNCLKSISPEMVIQKMQKYIST